MVTCNIVEKPLYLYEDTVGVEGGEKFRSAATEFISSNLLHTPEKGVCNVTVFASLCIHFDLQLQQLKKLKRLTQPLVWIQVVFSAQNMLF